MSRAVTRHCDGCKRRQPVAGGRRFRAGQHFERYLCAACVREKIDPTLARQRRELAALLRAVCGPGAA